MKKTIYNQSIKALLLYLLTFTSIKLNAQSGYALKFSSSGQYVSAANAASVNFGSSNDFTLETWINYTTSTNAGLISKGTGTGTILGYQMIILNNKLVGEFGNGTTFFGSADGLQGTTILNDGKWHHVAMVVSRSTNNITLYVDGNQEASATNSIVGQNITNTANLYIGNDRSLGFYFPGLMDEVRIWTSARSQTEIRNNRFTNVNSSSSNLVAYYKCDNGSGTSLTDATTNANNGTLQNSPSWVVSTANISSAGNGNALNFDGTNDYVATGISVSNNTAYTIEFWMNPTSITNGGDERIISSGGGGTTSSGLRFQNGKIEFWDGSVWVVITNSTIPINAWTHFALTCNTAGQIISYVNGVAEITTTRSNTFWTNLNIGSNYVLSFGSYYYGAIDEFRYWTTTRSQSEIYTNMYAFIEPTTSSLGAYYRFDEAIAGGTNTNATTLTDLTNKKYGTLNNFALTGTTSNWIASTLTCATSSTTNLSVCPSALPYIWNGLTFNGSGSQSKTFAGANSRGCDSVATLTLSLNSTSSSTTNLSVCSNNLPYNWNGLIFSGAGTQTKTGLINSAGCDSTATLILSVTTVTPSITAASSTTFCSGGSVNLSVAGIPGNAVTLGSQYINLSSNTNLRAFPKTAFTLETWVKPTTTSGNQLIMYNGLCNQACPMFSLSIGGESGCVGGNVANKYNFKFSTSAGNFNLVSNASATTSWTHVAVSYDGSTSMKIYINGSLDNSLTISGTPINPSSYLFVGVDPAIGGCGSSRYPFNGSLDEMRIWNIARSASQISNNYTSTVASNSSNLILYYQFNSSTGTTAVDATSNGYNGAFSGTPTWGASNAFGFVGYSWSPGGAITSSITANAAGNYTVTATDVNGCVGTASQLVTVNTATTSSNTAAACGSYTWNGVTYTSSGTYTKTFTGGNSNGCDSTATLVLTINTATTSSTSQTACSSYTWNGVTYTSSGTYTKTFTGGNSNGCDSIATLVLTINALPVPTISSSGPTTFCSGGSVNLSLVSSSPGNAATLGSQYINLSSNTALRAFPKTAFTLETWVKPTATSGNQVIMYNGLCNQACPMFSLSIGGEPSCTGGNVSGKYNFKLATSTGNYSVASNASVVANNWTHVAVTYDGTSLMKIYVNGNLDNSITISGTPNNPSNYLFIGADPGIGGCGSTRYQYNGSLDEMRIWNVARSASQIAGNYAATVAANSSNLILYYQFNSSTGTTAVDATSNAYNGAFSGTPTWAASGVITYFPSYSWTPGGATQSITASTSGTYTITVTDLNGCTGSASQVVTVNQPTSSTNNLSICSNQLPYVWNGVTFTDGGAQTAHLISSNGCDSAATLNLTVKQTSSSNNTANVCSNQLPYSWNGLTFTSAGTKTAHLTNSVGCDSSATLTITVGAPVTPSVSISTASNNICSGSDVSFAAVSSNGGSSPNFQWKRNGSNVGSGSSITFLANTLSNGDVITCELTANNSCQTTATAISNAIQMTVKQSPSMTPITNQAGATITFASICNFGTTTRYGNATPFGVWNSSNPTVASITYNGFVTANNAGTTTISYNVEAANGCISSSTVLITVSQEATPNVILGNSNVCANSTIQLISSTLGGVWSTGQTSQATVNSSTGVVLGKSAGIATINYTVTNAAGCSATVSKGITVYAVPAVPLIAYAPGTNTSVIRSGSDFCNNKTFTVVGNPTGGAWSKTGVINVTSPAGLVTTGNVLGAGTLTYTFTDANGCSNSRSLASNVVSCAARGINNEQLAISNIDFTMYPNPAHSQFTIYHSQLIGAGSIVITDLYGKAIKNQPLSMGINIINVSNLSKGMYLVSMITNEGKTTKKLVVE